MRSTGRLYLRINESVDERNDPLHATRAAARKFRQDFEMLQTWPLTITGWNHGAAGVRRLVEKFGTKDIVELTDVRVHFQESSHIPFTRLQPMRFSVQQN